MSTFKSRAFWQLLAGLVPAALILWALLLPWLRRTFPFCLFPFPFFLIS